MSESSLYRKYRPQEFQAVRGQDHITSVLEAAITKAKLGHAYLFSGSRGTGKTSTARIFAKAIGTDPRDLYELDAASNNGVEDIRQILDGVSTHPFGSEYKVYIIDEVHMLSKAAFNAFLKTLEEPPAYVVFILATTELEKVPETIRSRCQVFEFKKPTREILKTLIRDVAKKEGADIEPSGAELIAMMGDGSYRDTLSILQKVLTLSSDKTLTEEEVAQVVGAPKSASVHAFIGALAGKDIEGALSAMSQCLDGGVDPKLFAQLVIAKLRGVLLLRFGGKDMRAKVADQFGEEDAALLQTLSGTEGAALNSQVLSEFLGAYVEMARAPMPALSLELAVYRALGRQ
jgi:DNA polymerase III subunit gamma/tau